MRMPSHYKKDTCTFTPRHGMAYQIQRNLRAYVSSSVTLVQSRGISRDISYIHYLFIKKKIKKDILKYRCRKKAPLYIKPNFLFCVIFARIS